ncbi:Uncharacterized protein C15orf41-like protein [Trichoplax sp. H2]|nr:Uncharacterized protein C15orf41-like protein [Trichoplax sp. H2]|eukprot:RDD47367.1 Uncharacterized protein C15orf41-like protein [Trichoplax sp. H2]
MALPLAKYKRIISVIKNSTSRECLTDILKLYPGVTYNTLVSIYSQEYQKKIKKEFHRHHSPDMMERYYQRYLTLSNQDFQESILQLIANEVDLSAFLLARIVVERHLAHLHHNGNSPPRTTISNAMKDITLLQNDRLAREVEQCILNDANYGPLIENVKHSTGLEYEYILREKLNNLTLAFLDENDMRLQGYDKTPDIKLEVPIAVNGNIVNWIESKASFGDEHSHATYMKDQYYSYLNRFGPGMVIYWFGFIKELNFDEQPGILIVDSFPLEIITLKACTDHDCN